MSFNLGLWSPEQLIGLTRLTDADLATIRRQHSSPPDRLGL